MFSSSSDSDLGKSKVKSKKKELAELFDSDEDDELLDDSEEELTPVKVLSSKYHSLSSPISSPIKKRKEDEYIEYDDDMEDEIEEMDDEEDGNFSNSENEESQPTTKKAKANSTSSNNDSQKKSKNKLIHFESVHVPMGDKSVIEKLLDYRTENGKEEILVKYKNMSYYHAEWLARATIEEQKLGKNRVKRFLDKGIYESQWSQDESFNPNFVKIDRLIDEGEVEQGQIYFLVKWCSQTYDLSTWETEETVEEIDPDKIEEFHQSRVLTDARKLSYEKGFQRPPAKSFKKLDGSPVYKNDNTLRPYQLEGLNWLLFCYYNGRNSILADEMGLGKTIQSTSFLYHLFEKLNAFGPFLIVTPLSTIGNWEREIKTWTTMNVVVYHGKESARNLLVETEFYFKDSKGNFIPNIFKFDVVLTTYEMAMSGLNHLKPINWRVCVLDEAHKLKNTTSKISETLKLYKMDYRLLLTGTPLQNSLDELWSLLNFLEPDRFPDEKEFQSEFGSMATHDDVEKIQALLKPLMLRRLKEDVEKSIPSKEETIIEVELTTMQKKWYKSILEKNFNWLKQGAKSKNMPNLINTMMELRKCCIHPFLLKGAEDQIISEYSADTAEKQFAALIQASGKMVLIDKLLTKLKAGGHKVLIFSQMTRCLDIIQDYLRGKRYGFERIDGSVRGDLRQASIDRFCSRESESFVFLLCTRAGGVGINLTVADTVIIFDSDWNPQNDLQAQARCHRIGQTKSVQIYRLITRNTYERDMFDRASMKLGLDKAILQRMDVNASMREEDPFESKAPSALSKQEVEKLLKKGAYGAFLDDEASEKFCEEDIDSILERRTQVIKHDSGVTTEKGSIFSKASFASAQSNQVDIDDPDFWDKIAAKAELHIEEPLDELDTLIQYEPRQRRQVRRFGADEIGGDSDDDDYNIGDSVTSNNSAADPSIKLWSITEKTRFERALMLYGYGCWEKILPLFPRREEKDLIAVTDLIMKFCIKRSIQDPDLVRDIRRILDIEITDESALDENLENPIRLTEDIILPEIPYEGATKKQISEYRSFLLDASKEYQEHIERKSKNLLNRIQMLYGIRFRVQPHPEIEMPPILGNPPVPWWGADEDRDLLLGTLKYGYAAYDKMRYDPEFCFNKRVYIDTLESVTIDELAEAKKGKISELPEGQENSGKLSQNNEELQDIVKENNDVKKMTIEGGETDVETVDIEKEEKLTKEVKNTTDDASSELSQVEEKVLDAKEGEAVKWPGPADLGVRIRRILAAFLRQFATIARRSAKKQLREEKNKEKRTNEAERRRQFTKKERIEFRRVLLSFGVETDPNNRNVRIWDRFRYLSAIHKTDEVLEENYLNTISMCHECIEKAERIKDGKESKDELKYDKDDNKDDVNDENEEKDEKDDKDDDDKDDLKNFRIERGTESISLEIARRMLKRIEMMRKLREEIITHPNIDTNTGNIKRHQRSGLPSWWLPEHDKYFILGIARWGITRTDSMVEDETLPFKKMQEEWQRKRDAGDEVACKDERFWMKETVAGRRFDSLCEAILKPPQKKNKKGRKKRDDDLDSDDDAMWQGDTVKKKMKKKEVSPVQRQSSFSPIKKKKRKGKFNDGGYGSLDFGNPDDMLSSENESGLDRVLHRIKRERKLAKKLLFDNEESTIILNNAGNNIFQKSYFKRIKRDLRKDWKKLYFNKNIHEEKRNKLPPLENETNIFEVLSLAGNLIAECRKETELVLGLKKRKLSDAQNIISGESLKLSDF